MRPDARVSGRDFLSENKRTERYRGVMIQRWQEPEKILPGRGLVN